MKAGILLSEKKSGGGKITIRGSNLSPPSQKRNRIARYYKNVSSYPSGAQELQRPRMAGRLKKCLSKSGAGFPLAQHLGATNTETLKYCFKS
jgi:hypothetical protein